MVKLKSDDIGYYLTKDDPTFPFNDIPNGTIFDINEETVFDENDKKCKGYSVGWEHRRIWDRNGWWFVIELTDKFKPIRAYLQT